MRGWKQVVMVGLAAAVSVGCGGSGSSSSSKCTNIAGTWGVTGACGPDNCVVTQNGCSTNFSCGGGSHSYTGSVSGNSVSYSGQTAGGVPATCSGTVSGATMSGTCSGAGASCTFAAAKQ